MAVVFASVLPAFGSLEVATAADPSVCVREIPGCHVVGGIVNMRVELGAGVPMIIGGQFALEYDSAVLAYKGISPGATCDPLSPFASELFRDVSEANGAIFYAVTVDFNTSNGTQGPATIACLTFQVLAPTSNTICLVNGISPYDTLLSDDLGDLATIDNSVDCPPDNPIPDAIACDEILAAPSCLCSAGAPDCSAFESACSVGICNEQNDRCESLPINEGESCDDGDSCTVSDFCVQGVCRGTGCPNPSLCVVSDAECRIPTGTMLARVQLGRGNTAVHGGQFSFSYDPTLLRLVSVAPGSTCDPQSPFDSAILQNVDENVGQIRYAVLGGSAGSLGPATMACLTFAVRGLGQGDICVMEGVDPLLTQLVDGFGDNVAIDNDRDCPSAVPAMISCASSCEVVPAISSWGLVIMSLLLCAIGKVHFGLRAAGLSR